MNMVGRLPLENIAPAFRLAIYIYIKRLVGSGPLFRHGKTNLVKKRVEIPSPKFKHSKKLNHHNSPKGGLGIRPEIPPYFLARPREIWAKDCKVSTYLCFLPFFRPLLLLLKTGVFTPLGWEVVGAEPKLNGKRWLFTNSSLLPGSFIQDSLVQDPFSDTARPI